MISDDPHINALACQALAAYEAMTPGERRAHDREQAISWAYGQCRLSGSKITREEVARIYDEMRGGER